MYAYVGNNPTTRVDPSGLVVQCSSDLAKKDAQKCQEIIDLANKKGRNGSYVNPKLHSIYDRLNSDTRTFVIRNAQGDSTKLGEDVVGRFDIRQISNSGKDFAAGIINLDFGKIRAISEPTPSMIPGFSKYQGLAGKFDLGLAETFGHEGEHGVYA